MKNEKWYSSPWAVSIGTMLLTFAGTIIIDYSKEKPILTTVSNVGVWLGKVLVTFLTFDIKVWWLVLSVALLILGFIINGSWYGSKNEEVRPPFYNYRTQTFKYIKWTWSWSESQLTKKWSIVNLKAHCPKCDTTLIQYSGIHKFDCPRCEYLVPPNEIEQPYRIERLIEDNIRRNDYPILVNQ